MHTHCRGAAGPHSEALWSKIPFSETQLVTVEAEVWGAMAPLPVGISYGYYLAVYIALFFGIDGMGSATIFLWLQIVNVSKSYRTAMAISGIVTFIATTTTSGSSTPGWGAFEVSNPKVGGDLVVDWLLTVPRLLIQLIHVLTRQELPHSMDHHRYRDLHLHIPLPPDFQLLGGGFSRCPFRRSAVTSCTSSRCLGISGFSRCPMRRMAGTMSWIG